PRGAGARPRGRQDCTRCRCRRRAGRRCRGSRAARRQRGQARRHRRRQRRSARAADGSVMSEVALGASGARPQAVSPDALVRSILFIAVLMLIWVSPHPFQSLADPPSTTSDGGDRVNQIVFSLAFLALGGWAWLTGFERLKPILRPIMLLTIAWFALSVL